MVKKVFFCRERGASSFSGSIRGPAFASGERDGECAMACVRSDGAAVAGRKIERGEVVSGVSDFRVRACLRGRDAVASGRGRSGRGYGAARSVIRSRRDAAGSSGFGRGRLCGGNRRRVRFRFLRRVRALPIFLSAHAFAAACRVKETGCLHRQTPRCHKEVAVGYLRMAATPGSSMPSMYSSSAPPPVDT